MKFGSLELTIIEVIRFAPMVILVAVTLLRLFSWETYLYSWERND